MERPQLDQLWERSLTAWIDLHKRNTQGFRESNVYDDQVVFCRFRTPSDPRLLLCGPPSTQRFGSRPKPRVHRRFCTITDLASMFLEVPGHGPEDVSCTADGSMITGLKDGRIVRMTLDGRFGTLGDTRGRPVGLQVMPDGSVIIADARKGCSDCSRMARGACNEFEGRPILFADDSIFLPMAWCG